MKIGWVLVHKLSEQETRLSREDIPPLVVDSSTKLDAMNVFDSDNGDDSDNDDTIWNWMHADEDYDNELLSFKNNFDLKILQLNGVANDMGMLQEANIGIGFSGVEGMQPAN
ncbi:hypothetical protein QVD17_39519 [Tagetes erecta]|uniref:Uncharacterized protein n=1 Tax=Tagetes erecta TaxID=13708 RepID=A0AAD8JSG2_TARER|nr:hypothetical protein QVD17_39519 [Tagetes erecta]